jgi:high-affinity iron transporter
MLAALIIVFREVFEAGLLVGIVIAVTSSVPKRNRWIAGGVLAEFWPPALWRLSPGTFATVAGMGQDVQRVDPLHRRGDADVAQCLDGAPRP